MDAFWAGVRASARRRPPGAEDIQMSGGMGTQPVGPMPWEAMERGTGSLGRAGPGEVSEDWWSGKESASVWRMWRVVRRRERSSAWGSRLETRSQPAVQDSHERRRERTCGGGTLRRWARRRVAPRRCMRVGSEQLGHGREVNSDKGQWWRWAPDGKGSVGRGRMGCPADGEVEEDFHCLVERT